MSDQPETAVCMTCGHEYIADEYKTCPECDNRLWQKRKEAIAEQILRVIAEAPRDLIVQGKRYQVTMRSYERGSRTDVDGTAGLIIVSSEDEHFDYELSVAGWGTLSSIHPHEEEEGD